MQVHRRRWRMGAAALAALVLTATPAGAKETAITAKGATKPKHHEKWIDQRIRHMTLEEKVGQLFVQWGAGETVDDRDPANVSANRQFHDVDTIRELVRRYHLGGFIDFTWADNLNSPRQVAALSNGLQRTALKGRSKVPLAISVDQEQGAVVRFGDPATQFPGGMGLGATRSTELAGRAARITAQELRAVGINQNYAPVADVNVNPANPIIGVRSFGEEPELVSRFTATQVLGLQRAGVSAAAKHFPGHGDTDTDSHTGLPVITHSLEELDRIDLPPFRAAIAAGVDTIMTAHIVVPALDDSGRPATLSRPILTGLLRERLGFDGVIVTDALNMQAVRDMFGDDRVPVEALKAGADQLLFPPKTKVAYDAVVAAVRSGELSERRIEESVRRILRVKLRRGIVAEPFADERRVDDVVGTPAHRAAADAIADRSITLVRNDAGLLPLAPGPRRVLLTAPGVLADELAARGATVDVLETGDDPGDAAIAEAVARAGANDLTVVTTRAASAHPAQQRLVQELLDAGRPMIVIAVDVPYDIARFPAAPTYLATYNPLPVALRSLARVLFGEVDPSGRLPVTIPRADDPSTPLFPIGTGLSY